MKIKSILKKLPLIILGVALSLIFLEFLLRFISFTISSYQCYQNEKELRNKSQYTILCLGESTTFLQYPVQLQKILNKKYPNKFSVIDAGIPGVNLETILDLIDSNIEKYRPTIAICMMGNEPDFIINGINYNNPKHISENKKSKLKLINLFLLSKKYMQDIYNSNKKLNNTEEEEENLLNIAVKAFYNKQDSKKTNELLKKLLEQTEKDSELYQQIYSMLIFNYRMLGEEQIAYEMSLNAIRHNYYYKDRYYETCFSYLQEKPNNLISSSLIRTLLKDKDYCPKIIVYNNIEHYLTDSEKQILLNKILSKKGNEHVIALQYLKQKDYQKAEQFFTEAEEKRLKFPDETKYELYKLILRKLNDKNIKIICMQYPIRSIKPLQEQLKKESYYDRITFVSNEKIFKKALMKKDYEEIFRDQFAGDFGHCTDLGNTLIAKNIVNTLENILNLEH